MYGLGISALILIQPGVEQQARHADDAVHRGADLMAHVGEESPLRVIGEVRLFGHLPGLGDGRLELSVHPFQFPIRGLGFLGQSFQFIFCALTLDDAAETFRDGVQQADLLIQEGTPIGPALQMRDVERAGRRPSHGDGGRHPPFGLPEVSRLEGLAIKEDTGAGGLRMEPGVRDLFGDLLEDIL